MSQHKTTRVALQEGKVNRILSLCQPYASCVALRLMSIHTSAFATDFRGLIHIHAEPLEDLETVQRRFLTLARRHPLVHKAFYDRKVLTARNLPFGALVATCRLADCVPTIELSSWVIPPHEKDLGGGSAGYSYGRFGWILTDATPLDPPQLVAGPGAQTLWEMDDAQTQA